MSHTTSLRRTASALGATALLGMVLAAPAMARPDPGEGGPAVDSSTATSQFPYGLERERREGGTMVQPAPRQAPEVAKPAQPTIVFMEDDAVEYLQIGAGVIAGIALVGAGAVVASRINPRGLKPA